ncbi:MAG: 4Fe-4S dicluster domain-containing protein [Candidatus Bathyarchaeota archaeon]|nr:4Fe-4S dicluster domain-containing protein [Candidatus Bathyarchaeota archaeon]
MKAMSKHEWQFFINNLIEEGSHKVIGVKAKGEKFVFGPLDSAEELRLDYDTTILPPKKYFLPTHEDLMRYDISQPFNVLHTVDESPRIIIGIHPYDLIAILQMDKLYLDDTSDDHYKAARKNTLIIASDIINVSQYSFAASMATHMIARTRAYDLLVTDLGEVVAIDIGTESGKLLLEKHGKTREASEEEIVKVEELREDLASKYEKKVNVEKTEWPALLSKNYDHLILKEKSEKCLACGSCTLVCPTCFCYDVEDLLQLNGKEGVRRRTWDGCLMREFTKVASGEIFREKILDRYRHRIFRKGYYLPERYDFIACVGCGRCVSACLPDIADPSDILNSMTESPQSDEPVISFPQIPKTDVVSIDSHCLFVPTSATIKRIEHLTYCETLYELVKDDQTPLGHQPGQFIQVSLFGIGEAPFSVSSAPGGKSFEIVVRQIGEVTSKLRTLKVGDKVGIRGPFGRGFDIDSLKSKDLLFIAGGLGIVPMRSLINYVLRNKTQFNDVTILYGCKEPNEFLFWDEISKWHKRKDITHMFTVDSCPEGVCWDGDIGVITTLLPKVDFNPETTKAIVIGPPIMYQFVIKDLEKKGMKDENILISLERKMRCGVGKCGHCQIHGMYVCKEGPVFNYAEIKDLPEAI